MSTYYNEEREVYIRFARRLDKLLEEDQKKLSLRKHPGVIRQDECFRVPSLNSSFKYLAYYLYLIFQFPEADYQVSIVLNHILSEARRNKFEGSWRIWKQISIYFNLEVEQGEKEEEPLNVPQLNLSSTPEEVEGTVYSTYYFIEFLLTYVSEDTLFGNLCLLASRLGLMKTKIETFGQRARRLERAKVRRKQRHRGHTDKGSRDVYSQKSPRVFDVADREPGYDALTHVRTWGIEDTPDPVMPEEEPPKPLTESQIWAQQRYKELLQEDGG